MQLRHDAADGAMPVGCLAHGAWKVSEDRDHLRADGE